MMRSVLAPQPLLSLTAVSVWAHFTQTAWMPAMITASHVHRPAGFDSTLLSFILSILPYSPSLFICLPPLPPSGEVLLAALQNFLFHFGDWQCRWYLPFICILCRLLSIPATNGGDSQAAVPELACSSLGVRAGNQRLWWEGKDSFKLNSSQSTGGAHESATSRRFSPSWGSLQIECDSTLLTSETPTRASPIKSLIWFPLLIINAYELGRDVIGKCLWDVLVHVHICKSSICACHCGCKCVRAFFFQGSAHVLCLFMYIQCRVSFHVVVLTS